MSDFWHLYPWQVVSRSMGTNLSCRLRGGNWIDADQIVAETKKVITEIGLDRHFGEYHDGGWSSIGLISHEGNPHELRRLPGKYVKTPALTLAPYLESIIDNFQCDKERVRIMALQPGKNIHWHYDPTESIDAGDNARLHIPIITNPGVQLQICHEDLIWRPGELWYGDFSFPHRLRNKGRAERIHLVLDLKVSDYVTSLFPPSFLEQKERRSGARRWCQNTFDRIEYMDHLRSTGFRGVARKIARRLADAVVKPTL
jgi:aspartyl/asparaginyl beta-hydroxylase